MKMSEQARRAKARYMKQWREKNREKWRAYQAKYWEKRAAREQQDQGES